MSSRQWPNILITGTPGTGKTSHCTQLLAEAGGIPLQHVNIGDLVKAKGLHHGWNEEWQSYDVDEDTLLDELEPLLSNENGGVVLEWHACDLFPERWFDLVVVLRCDHSLLWTRQEKRNYPLHKIQENNQAEIMQVILDEARESYAEEVVVALTSETPEEIESNVARIQAWIQQWRTDNQAGSAANA